MPHQQPPDPSTVRSRISVRRAAFSGGRLEPVGEAGEVSRAALLIAAAAAFRQEGFAATSIERLARRIGATKGLIYHHYRSKEDLFLDVCRRGLEIAFASIEPIAGSRDRAVTRLRRMAEAHVLATTEHGDFRHAVLQGIPDDLVSAVGAEDRVTLAGLIAERDRYRQLFAATLEAAIDEGDLAPGSAAPIAVRALLAVIDAPLSAPLYSPGGSDPAAIARDLALFALRGAGVGPAIVEDEF